MTDTTHPDTPPAVPAPRVRGGLLRRLRSRDERGMTTSEYAVGTVGTCGIAGVIATLVQSDWFESMMTGIFDQFTELLPF